MSAAKPSSHCTTRSSNRSPRAICTTADGTALSIVSPNIWQPPEGARKTMGASNTEAGKSTDRTLVVERIFDAPRSLVFSAWIEPQHLLRWFGPRGFTVPSYTLDPRPGGSWRVCMVSPDGVEHWVRGSFREILEPERLAFTW